MLLIFHALLIMCGAFSAFGQDTIYVDDKSMGDLSKYYARDSVFADLREKKLHLYGKAYVESEGMNLTAGYIVLDMVTQEIKATYSLDAEGEIVDKPIFNMGGDKVEATTLKFNMESKKAYIEGVKIKQDEMVLHMGQAKRQTNEEIHFINGKFTTCDLDEPHYHFQLSKGVMVPDKRIVTGPMNLYIAGVPTPLGLPFSYIPQNTKERSHGILFPEIIPTSVYGMGLNRLGYYIPINDYVQTSIYGSIYSKGSWGLANSTEYKKKYGYSGKVDISYYRYNAGFPTNSKFSNVDVKWAHRKDEKSNPKWNFNTNINFVSSNNTKKNIDLLNQNYFNNTLMSDINLNRIFPGKPYRLAAKINLNQNSQSKNITLTSPIINFSTSQFFPLKSVSKKEIFQRLGVTYNIEGQNKSTFKDTLLRDKNFAEIGNQFMYGMRQRLTIQTTGGLFKNVLKINPSVNYGTDLNFQQTIKSYDAVTNQVVTDTINKLGLAHNLSMNISATTVLYSYYRFVGKNKPLMRHILTPNVSFSYRPLLTPNAEYIVPNNPDPIRYSTYSNSVYSYSATNSQGLINFGLNNTFELKRKSDKDTITGYQKIRIIESLSLTGNYDIMRDSMNLSDISLSLRLSPFKFISIVANSRYSFYGWDSITNASVKEFALSNNGRLGRSMSNNITTTLTLTSKESRDKIEQNRDAVAQNWQADYDFFYLHPERIVDYTIPWKINLSHVFSVDRNTFKTLLNNNEFRINHTINVNADVSLTKRWKLAAGLNFDLKTKKVVHANFTLNRDLHCWALSFRWIPIGMNKSFTLTIRNTSNMFKDAKLEFKKPPVFL